MGSFLDFAEVHDTGKTKVFNILSKSGDVLGKISWFSNWRKYTFWPEQQTIFDSKCLIEIVSFINDLMEERKNETNR